MSTGLRVGTRGSSLARRQTDLVIEMLRRGRPDLEVEVRVIVTEGDRFQAGPVADAGGKAVWVKEIEERLLDGGIDLAVHSLKDVPAELPGGLALAAIPPRADPRDVLVSRSGAGLDHLPAESRVGTSSLRRACQLRALRPDLRIETLRGNVETRLRRVIEDPAESALDAAVLAGAGLDRLGLGDCASERLPVERMIPAVGQGALALESRGDDHGVLALCRTIADAQAEVAVAAERAFLAALGAGCRTPVAGHARLEAGRLEMWGLVGRPDGREIVRDHAEGPPAEAASIGTRLAERLLARGADRILAELG